MESLLDTAGTYLNTLDPREMVWIGIGFLGQFLFMTRFLWQWVQSERQRRSIIPMAFWYFSLAGGMTLFAYAFAFAEMGVASNRGNYRRGLSLVLGVFLGSAIWWSLLAVGAGWFKGKLDSVGMRWINRVTGIVVIGFAIYELVEVVKLAR